MAGNADAAQRLIRAFQEGEIEAALADLDPEVELFPIRAQLEGTSYVGHDGYRRLIADFEADWEGLRLLPEQLHESGEVVVASGRLVATGKASGLELDVPLALLYEFRDGLVVRVRSFSEPEEALRAAGIEG